jgi:heme-degrading monooxygenase HmoA
MINRIVKMTFSPEYVDDFVRVFHTNKHLIAGFDGCHGVELLRDITDPNIFFTYSKWQTVNHLEDYRNSALFNEVWKTVKKWFAAKPEAWSVKLIADDNGSN